jgi:hypothetical protein
VTTANKIHLSANSLLASIDKKIGVFPKKYERINLTCGAVAAIFCLGLAIWSPALTVQRFHWYMFISEFILLNTGHAALTIFFLIITFEFRQVALNSIFTKKSITTTAIVACVIGIYAVLRYSQLSGSNGGKLSFDLITAFFLSVMRIHITAQVFGISMLYNLGAKSGLEIANPKAFRRIEGFERLLFKILLFCGFLSIFCSAGILLDAKWGKLFEAAAFLSCVCIFLLSFCYENWRKSNKSLYLIRILFLAVAYHYAYSIVPIIFMAAAKGLHGIEYLCLSKQIVSKTKSKIQVWGNVGLLMALLLATVLVFPLSLLRVGKSFDFIVAMRGSFLVWYVMAEVILLLHCYLDGIVFRLRRPEVKQWVLPLISN